MFSICSLSIFRFYFKQVVVCFCGDNIFFVIISHKISVDFLVIMLLNISNLLNHKIPQNWLISRIRNWTIYLYNTNSFHFIEIPCSRNHLNWQGEIWAHICAQKGGRLTALTQKNHQTEGAVSPACLMQRDMWIKHYTIFKQ